jgi:DNA polymerase epsilon subunit 1
VKFIISKLPLNASVTDRAIPTIIFDTDEAVMKKYLRKWTGDGGMQDFDLRTIIDWNYYKDRLAGTIMKIVTIPAALQNCCNPVPQIEYPEWLLKKIKTLNDKVKQRKLSQFFKPADIEDLAQKKIKFDVAAA